MASAGSEMRLNFDGFGLSEHAARGSRRGPGYWLLMWQIGGLAAFGAEDRSTGYCSV